MSIVYFTKVKRAASSHIPAHRIPRLHLSLDAAAGQACREIQIMIVLDTDDLSVLKYHDSPLSRILEQKLDAAREPIFTSIVSIEEQLRGWLSFIKSQSNVTRLVDAYRELEVALHFSHAFRVVPFDLPSAESFAALKRQRIRIGTQDLKIAAMVLANDATLLSRNLQDFSKVPGLKVQNWLE